MRTQSRVSLKFKRPQEFAQFCMTLTEDDVPFTHAGCQTIVLAKNQIDNLAAESLRLFKKFQADKLFELSPTTSVGKRSLVRGKDAENLLKRFAERWAKAH